MPAVNQHVIEAENFDVEVIERSHEIPVLVDFWAPWCGPCKALTPVLEEVAAESRGTFVLAKLNTDEHPEVAERYRIRGIPAVKLIVAGEVVGEFTGVIPGSSIRQFLAQHLPSDADRLVTQAATLAAKGDEDGALAQLETAVALDSGHPKARLQLARMALARGDAQAVEAHVDAVDLRELDTDTTLIDALRKAATFVGICREAGGESACRARLQDTPGDLDARFALGCCLATQQRWEEALETLLDVVKVKPGHADAAAHKAMVTIFDLIGRRSDLADHYVRQLQIYS